MCALLRTMLCIVIMDFINKKHQIYVGFCIKIKSVLHKICIMLLYHIFPVQPRRLRSTMNAANITMLTTVTAAPATAPAGRYSILIS